MLVSCTGGRGLSDRGPLSCRLLSVPCCFEIVSKRFFMVNTLRHFL